MAPHRSPPPPPPYTPHLPAPPPPPLSASPSLPPLPWRAPLYPLLGIPHLLRHRELHAPVLSRLPILILLSLIVLGLLFGLLYIPHVLLLSIFYRKWFAWGQAAVMILTEASTIVAILAEAFLTERQCVEVFDRVWIGAAEDASAEGAGGEGDPAMGERMVDMMRGCRDVQPRIPGGWDQWRLGEHRKDFHVRMWDSFRVTLWFILELPINLVPIVGTPVFLCLQGYHLGPLQHYRYFQLRGFSKKERKAFIARERTKYCLFGITHVILQLVPVLSILFLFTSATGASLWAIDYENRIRRLELEASRDPASLGATPRNIPYSTHYVAPQNTRHDSRRDAYRDNRHEGYGGDRGRGDGNRGGRTAQYGYTDPRPAAAEDGFVDEETGLLRSGRGRRAYQEEEDDQRERGECVVQ